MVWQQKLWNAYVWKRQTVRQLAKQYHKSEKWIRTQLDNTSVTRSRIPSEPVVVIADTTFYKRTFGVCVLRSPHLKKNLIWQAAEREAANVYRGCRWKLEQQGFEITAAVIDGKPGLIPVFWDVPIQMCHFHQIKIVTRHLTSRPKLPAGQALRILTLTLSRTTEEEFSRGLDEWHTQWHSFLKEKTLNPETRRWFYTHKRLRSAYRSLKTNLPFLFTYQRYLELKIPNTTNSLDGTFSHLKDLLRIHRGLNRTHKLKIINEILSK